MWDWRAVVTLGCVSLALGALTPWAVAWVDQPQATQPLTRQVVSPQSGPQIAAAGAAAPEKPLEGVIAIGDATMLDAQQCLEERGIDVFPKQVDTAEDLLAVLQQSVGDRAAVFIHTGTESGVVDGQIERAIDVLGPSRRLVWATVQIPDPDWGAFSFEERTNASIRNVVGRHAEGRVLDWNAATAKHPEWTLDGIRMSRDGCREYAGKVLKLSGLPRGT